MNFWLIMLAGLLKFFEVVLTPLFGGAGNFHAAMGFAKMIGDGAYIILELVFVTFGQFNLVLLGLCLGLMAGMWVIGALIKLWMLLKGMVPFAG